MLCEGREHGPSPHLTVRFQVPQALYIQCIFNFTTVILLTFIKIGFMFHFYCFCFVLFFVFVGLKPFGPIRAIAWLRDVG